MDDKEQLVFENREEWRSWLQKNHLSTQKVWLYIRKKKSKMTGIRLEEAVEEAICFGWIDGRMNSLDEDGYLLSFTPRRENSRWSLLNKLRDEKSIEDGRMTKAGLEAVRRAKVNGNWDRAYTSRTEPLIPADLEEALKEDENADKNFSSWNNSWKLQVIVWLEDSRHQSTRRKRIVKIVDWARENRIPGMEG